MRTAELADLAGVTIRTIRHYHQIGVLPEPPRTSNGYRDYSVDHVVTLLRIAQLTSSGLSLTQAGAVVAESTDTAEDLLDTVEQSLDFKIAALTAQRENLRRARASGHVGVSRVAAALSLSAEHIAVAEFFSHLYGDQAEVSALAEQLLQPQLRSELERLQQRFESIDGQTTQLQLQRLQADLAAAMPQGAGELPPLSREQSAVALTLMERDLNERQKDFLRLYFV